MSNLGIGGQLQKKQGGLCSGKRCVAPESGRLQEERSFYGKPDECVTLKKRCQCTSVSGYIHLGTL